MIALAAMTRSVVAFAGAVLEATEPESVEDAFKAVEFWTTDRVGRLEDTEKEMFAGCVGASVTDGVLAEVVELSKSDPLAGGVGVTSTLVDVKMIEVEFKAVEDAEVLLEDVLRA